MPTKLMVEICVAVISHWVATEWFVLTPTRVAVGLLVFGTIIIMMLISGLRPRKPRDGEPLHPGGLSCVLHVDRNRFSLELKRTGANDQKKTRR